MSLLMKALEKAAQDRSNTTDKPVATAATSAPLTLEPVVAPRSTTSASSEASIGAKSTGNASHGQAAPARGTGRSNDQTRAAVLLSTQHPARTGTGAIEWISTHPVPFAAALAGVLALGYAVYLYLQIAHPQLFLHAPVAQTLPVAITPAPAAPAPTAPSQEVAPADAALIPAQSVFSSKPAVSTPAPAGANAVTAGTASTTGTIAPKPAPAIAAPATPVATVAPTQQSKILVSRGDNAAPRVNAAVSDAYAALESGRFEAARPLYEQALRNEPSNIDALLGLAAIAQHENRADDASKHYLKILDIDPRHAMAQTGLIALLGRADPQAAETRLKQLAAREPSPSLFFTLGNLYADQGQWSQAQQAYFQSHHLEPGNPDYAYNLAVALEHLGQQKLALGFYRRALQLATGRGRANFNTTQAQARITQLAARLE